MALNRINSIRYRVNVTCGCIKNNGAMSDLAIKGHCSELLRNLGPFQVSIHRDCGPTSPFIKLVLL